MISKRVKKIAPSGIREFFDLVLEMPEIISLGVGEPDFVTPWRIRERAITALEEGYTSYTSNKGISELRKKISHYFAKKYGLNYNPEEEILITSGASQGLDLAIRALLDPQDKAVVVNPYYVAYPALIELCGAQVIHLKTKARDNFKINLKELVKALDKNPKLLLLNYPSNPTGATYSKQELEGIQKKVASSNTFVVSDEIYHQLSYRYQHTPFAAVGNAREKAVLINGFSKGYAMTGFRVGYACGPAPVIEAMTKIQAFNMLCPPIISQFAALEAFAAEKDLNYMRQQYIRRREFVVKEFNRLGLSVVQPEGTFYCFPSIKSTGLNSLDFAKQLLFEHKVAVVPGRAFGESYDDFIRVSYANSLEALKEAVIRIEKFLFKNNGN
jgi:aminotransferase